MESQITETYFLSAARCTPEDELPLPALVQKLIDIATLHANRIDIGYDRLIKNNCAWVLSRVAIEMERWPGINESYSVTTWIVSLNRFYSDRAFRICDSDGNVIGHALTTWVAIDIDARRPANLLSLFPEELPVKGDIPPVKPFVRHSQIEIADEVTPYTFCYCDIDCNRHVNTTRYVELLLNRFDLGFFDENRISRFEIAFQNEAHFGDLVDVKIARSDNNEFRLEIADEKRTLTRAAITVTPRS